jgi:hypothetical protein
MIGRWFCAVSVGLLCLTAVPVCAQLVFDGVPTVKVESGERKTTRFVLSKKERMESRVTIVRREGRYYWASRENKELMRVVSGAFQYFISREGTGYVKVLDSHLLPTSMRPAGPRFQYMEHLPIMLGTITYWGASDKFDPLGADLVIPVARRSVRLSSTEWRAMPNEAEYASNFEAVQNESPRQYQIVTLFMIPMSEDRRSGSRLSENEYLEVFLSNPGEITVLVRRDHGAYWVLSREMFKMASIAGVDTRKVGSLSGAESDRVVAALRDEIDATRHLLGETFSAR